MGTSIAKNSNTLSRCNYSSSIPSVALYSFTTLLSLGRCGALSLVCYRVSCGECPIAQVAWTSKTSNQHCSERQWSSLPTNQTWWSIRGSIRQKCCNNPSKWEEIGAICSSHGGKSFPQTLGYSGVCPIWQKAFGLEAVTPT